MCFCLREGWTDVEGFINRESRKDEGVGTGVMDEWIGLVWERWVRVGIDVAGKVANK